MATFYRQDPYWLGGHLWKIEESDDDYPFPELVAESRRMKKKNRNGETSSRRERSVVTDERLASQDKSSSKITSSAKSVRSTKDEKPERKQIVVKSILKVAPKHPQNEGRTTNKRRVHFEDDEKPVLEIPESEVDVKKDVDLAEELPTVTKAETEVKPEERTLEQPLNSSKKTVTFAEETNTTPTPVTEVESTEIQAHQWIAGLSCPKEDPSPVVEESLSQTSQISPVTSINNFRNHTEFPGVF